MKNISKIALICITAFGLAGVANAQEKITKAEAQALVKKIVAYAKANGEEKAIAACNTPDYFLKGDGYIFAYDLKGVNVCHKNEKMRGTNISEMKDTDGAAFIQEMMKKCNSKAGSGWIKYKWPNAVTKALEPKQSYVKKYGTICWASGF
jgi:cytochrome c